MSIMIVMRIIRKSLDMKTGRKFQPYRILFGQDIPDLYWSRFFSKLMKYCINFFRVPGQTFENVKINV